MKEIGLRGSGPRFLVEGRYALQVVRISQPEEIQRGDRHLARFDSGW